MHLNLPPRSMEVFSPPCPWDDGIDFYAMNYVLRRCFGDRTGEVRAKREGVVVGGCGTVLFVLRFLLMVPPACQSPDMDLVLGFTVGPLGEIKKMFLPRYGLAALCCFPDQEELLDICSCMWCARLRCRVESHHHRRFMRQSSVLELQMVTHFGCG